MLLLIFYEEITLSHWLCVGRLVAPPALRACGKVASRGPKRSGVRRRSKYNEMQIGFTVPSCWQVYVVMLGGVSVKVDTHLGVYSRVYALRQQQG